MKADRDRIRAYYASGAEQGRLENDDGWFERDRTLSIIETHSAVGEHILDAGGGAGVYTVALAERGYRVTMVDLSRELVELARTAVGELSPEVAERVEAIEVADFAELDGSSYDAVLCAGPGYHVGSAEELRTMIESCVDVTRPGGMIYFSFVPRLSGVAGLVARAASSPDNVLPGTLTRVLETGRFANDAEGFCEAYFALPGEVADGFESVGVELISMRSIRGFAAYYGTALATLRDDHPDRFAEVLELTERTAEDPAVVASCWHAMCVGRH